MTSSNDHDEQEGPPEDLVFVDLDGFRAATIGLDLQAVGALMTLIMTYVAARDAPLDDDRALAAQVNCSPTQWRSLREQVSRFFEIRGGKWVRPSLERSLALADVNGGPVYIHFEEGQRARA